MQDQKEIERINRFLCMVVPIVTEIVRTILQSLSYEVSQKGQGLDLVLSIKAGKKEAEFYLHNLFLEVATVDRDEVPLRFDENLRDFDYFCAKMARLIASKLNVLFHFFGEDNVDAAIENITKDAKQYERIRIWKVDQKGPA
jgi:hypothetical protein